MKRTQKALLVTAIALMTGMAGFSTTPKAEAQVRHMDRETSTDRGRMIRNNFVGRDRVFRNNQTIRNDRFIRGDRFFRSEPFLRQRNYFRTDRDFLFRRGFQRHNFPVRVISNRDFFRHEGLFDRFPIFNRSFPSFISPREFVIIDRDNLDNFINIQNTLTGPFSVNRAFITVDSDFFNRFASDFEMNQDVSISVDTGNNVVRFNTVTGDISTGDVDISIQ